MQSFVSKVSRPWPDRGHCIAARQRSVEPGRPWGRRFPDSRQADAAARTLHSGPGEVKSDIGCGGPQMSPGTSQSRVFEKEPSASKARGPAGPGSAERRGTDSKGLWPPRPGLACSRLLQSEAPRFPEAPQQRTTLLPARPHETPQRPRRLQGPARPSGPPTTPGPLGSPSPDGPGGPAIPSHLYLRLQKGTGVDRSVRRKRHAFLGDQHVLS